MWKRVDSEGVDVLDLSASWGRQFEFQKWRQSVPPDKHCALDSYYVFDTLQLYRYSEA